MGNKSSGWNLHAMFKETWGNRMSASDWTVNQDDSNLAFRRGFTGHEHYDRFGIINMNARLYDPVLGRFFSPDPQVQNPFSTQGFNRYSYCGNNPVMCVDEDGESLILIAACIGAAIGMYSGGVWANGGEWKPWDWDFSSGRTWGYMLSGAIVGDLSGWAGATIATSGIPFANTISLGYSSFMNSLSTSLYSEGMSPVSISLGFASYNITNDEWGWLFKSGNEWYENVGYGLGAMANLSDILMGFQPQKVDLVTQYRDPEGTFDGIGHSSIIDIESDNTSIISVGPNYDSPGAKQSFFWTKGTNKWSTHVNDGSSVWRQTLMVNRGTIGRYANWLNRLEDASKLLYSAGVSSCVTHTSIALNMSGIFNIGIHPFLLNAEMFLWNSGVRPWTYVYLLNL